MNSILEGGKMADNWKEANIALIAKEGQHLTLRLLRAQIWKVSVLPTTEKRLDEDHKIC